MPVNVEDAVKEPTMPTNVETAISDKSTIDGNSNAIDGNSDQTNDESSAAVARATACLLATLFSV